ncbi:MULTISPECIES: FGGY family carbohydrate kinase [unclassified Inquilinus]|uniref:FGGY-family carbohydrate kinase n=1 Tax=unclassified Inquilinus TaxID=2645927 RepID=UPI003F933EAB
MPPLLLGLDAGTSVIKAALFGRDGRQVAAAARRTLVAHPSPSWSESDPEAAWSATVAVIREVLAGAEGRDVAAIGVSGAMVGAWVIDADGRPVRPGILWDDGRSQPWIEAMQDRDPHFLSRIFASSGSVMQQGCTLPVLRWLLDHEPEAMARADCVFGCKDFLRFRLTGQRATDPTEAAVAPGSALAQGRSDAILDLFGLQPHRRLLPPVLPCEAIAGTVTAAAAAETGLRPGTPVVTGAGDVAASVIGSGGLAPGSACTILGTTCLNGIVLPSPSFTPPDLGLLFSLPDRMWLRCMVNVAGTSNLDWCLRSLCPDLAAVPDPYAALEALAMAAAPGAGGAVYLPYLSEVGIIAPAVSATARAQFAGLAPSHGQTELVRAVYEGLAFAIRDCFEAMDARPETVLLSGGGGRSAFWSQMIADVLDLPVEIPAGTEHGARGAALLAATGIGWYPSVGEASRRTRVIRRSHRPDPALRPRYDAAFRRYAAHRDALLRMTLPSGTSDLS